MGASLPEGQKARAVAATFLIGGGNGSPGELTEDVVAATFFGSLFSWAVDSCEGERAPSLAPVAWPLGRVVHARESGEGPAAVVLSPRPAPACPVFRFPPEEPARKQEDKEEGGAVATRV
jgi:hypothetical protein